MRGRYFVTLKSQDGSAKKNWTGEQKMHRGTCVVTSKLTQLGTENVPQWGSE